jgi:hypothetical protein
LSPLQIYEYGIQLPGVLSEVDQEEDQEENIYLTFNQIDEIEVHDDVILIKGNHDFVISTYLIADDMLDIFIGIFDKISSKVAEVENKDYPTIIPRAYFKDLFRQVKKSE